MRQTIVARAAILVGGLLWGCEAQKANQGSEPSKDLVATPMSTDLAMADNTAKQAVAEIHGAGDNHDKIHGKVTFTQLKKGVKIVAEVEGLSPGKHGIHIHEKADLSKPDLSS